MGAATAMGAAGGPVGCLMQQPTSNYYHACYGAHLDLGNQKTFVMRTIYVERPEFDALGYRDKEFAYFLMAGRDVTKSKGHGLTAFAGIGQLEGYITANAETGSIETRRYEVPGPTFAAEYYLKVGPLNLSAGHQTLIGYHNSRQLSARVAWPYNFFTTTVGYSW